MELMNLLQHRHSVRSYTGEAVSDEALNQILQAGLISASSRSLCPWEFIVVRDKQTLEHLSRCRTAGAGMLSKADCAIVVVADEAKCDVWIEDCSIAMANMHLMADALGLGSCWVQGRLRKAPDGRDTEDYIRSLLHYPAGYRLEAMLSLGVAASHPAPRSLDSLDWSKVHRETF